MRAAAIKTWRGISWYLKQATGESRWDEYLERCRRDDVKPMSRRHFEQHRSEHQENHPQNRCC